MLDHRAGNFPAHGLVVTPRLRNTQAVGDELGVLEMVRLIVVLPGWNDKDVNQAVRQGKQQRQSQGPD
jgi:hypothetical protein